jgi:hypothetical protein
MQVVQRVRVPVRPLREILKEHLPPGQEIDYLNVDCEGLDSKVVAGNDWATFRPKIVSVEIHGLDLLNAMENPIVRMLADAGYRLRSHCEVTSIFERV